MENTISESISPIEKKISQFSENRNEFLKIKIGELCELRDIVSDLDNSWSGSWIGFHSKLYFQNFERIPSWEYAFDSEWGSTKGIPDYWHEKSYDDVRAYVEKRSQGLTLSGISQQISPILDEAKEIQKEMITDLIVLSDNPKFLAEVEIIDRLEKHRWGASVYDLITVRRPKHFVSRDAFAMQQGIQTPPHILYNLEVISELSKIESIKEFIGLAQRLIRQVNLKIKYPRENPQEESVNKINTIIERFPLVSRQLRNRHEKRNTLEIEDEYDVQDLLHSLLKIFFDDIRPEEWTPQYAGGSSRMDFLLKNEKIVIEVKKTRTSLQEKQVGEQLIIDVIKYKQHQDCRTLICFIFDPEGRIGNPKGLENDLNQMTTEDLQVIVKIAP